MARIRTIKPDFWTDEKLTECSLSARLMLIGMFNFADDKGNLARSAKKIKMQVFPADMIDCEPLIQELITQGLLIEYSVSGDNYLKIKGFLKHQVINRPSASSIPDIEITDNSMSTQGALQEGREGKGRDIEAKASLSGSSNPTDADQKTTKAPTCPIDGLIDLYEKTLPSMPRVRRSLFKTGKNGTAMRQRWAWVMTSMHERGERAGTRLAETVQQGVAWFERYFAYVADSKFLTENFSACDLGWLLAKENFEKVLSGRYENREGVAA